MFSSSKRIYEKVQSFFSGVFAFFSCPPENLVRKILMIQTPFVLILTLLPIINIAYIIATSGENNISNDVVFWVDLVDKILNHQATLSDFITRSFFYQHYIPLHFATELINIYLFNWNVRFTLFLGFAAQLVKLALLFDLFTFRFFKNPFKWLLLPVLSAAVFSNMEVTTFSGQNTATLIGMSLFGVVLSLWGIVRFQARIKGVMFCLLGGLISTWSFALGLIAWPLTLLAMILLGYRKIKQYILWFAGALVCIFPYAYFLYIKPVKGSIPLYPTLQTFLNLKFIVNMMGRPLSNLWTFDFTRQYKITGAIGFALAAACLFVFLLSLRKKKYVVYIAPLLIMALGLGGVWMASIGRPSLASWYITAAWPFWQGILGFGFIMLMQPAEIGTFISSLFANSKKIGAICLFLIVAYLYARSNIGNEVYGFLLYSRTPASASCLRSYQSAPTYCEGYLFQWPIQRPEYIFELGDPLSKNQLSVNAPQQQWSLQGDFIFDRVEEKRYANTSPIGWYEGLDGDRVSWFDIKRWHHLDVLLFSPNSMKWTVDFPADMESAVLKSAAGLRKLGDMAPEADGVTLQVTIEGDAIQKQIIFEKYLPADQHVWYPWSVDLSAYKGKKITIQFTSLPGKNNIDDAAMFQYPVINVKVPKRPYTNAQVTYTPENTDLSPEFKQPKANDVIWDGKDPSNWSMNGLDTVNDKPGFYIAHDDPYFFLKEPVNLCLADYTHFFVKYAVPPGTRRVAQIYYQLNDVAGFLEERSTSFTIIGDGKAHMYTYPIRLLDLDVGYNARLTNIRFDPAYTVDKNAGPIQFLEFGLLRGDGPSICQ